MPAYEEPPVLPGGSFFCLSILMYCGIVALCYNSLKVVICVGKRKRILLAAAAGLLAALVIWIAWGNSALELNIYTITGSRLPKAFDGYRIAHISDLHNAEMGKENEDLLDMLRTAAPDMIVITGDLIDSRHTEVEIALRFIQEAVTIAPCYYVTGNHEARVAAYDELKAGMTAAGVTILEDRCTEITVAGESICLIGVNDPSFRTDYLFGDAEMEIRSKLAAIHRNSEAFTILLSHRPELFEVYADQEIDLVFSGHAHGGQFRLPFIGGVVAPNQGLFPEYDAGIYTDGATNMVVSRGVGNSIIPFRFNNRPEVILIELRTTGTQDG